jgi:Ribosomal protein S21
MLSHLVRHTSTVLCKSPIIQWLPSFLFVSRVSTSVRAHSESDNPPSANWSHLNDIYSTKVTVKRTEPSMTPEERWALLSHTRNTNPPPLKGPYAGRTIISFEPLIFSWMCVGRSFEVKHGNVADALNKLRDTLNRNRVYSELKISARHEKKGYKRRRLSSERWRRRFAHEVLARLLSYNVTYSDQRFPGSEKGSTGEQDSCSRRIDIGYRSAALPYPSPPSITHRPQDAARCAKCVFLLPTARKMKFYDTR